MTFNLLHMTITLTQVGVSVASRILELALDNLPGRCDLPRLSDGTTRRVYLTKDKLIVKQQLGARGENQGNDYEWDLYRKFYESGISRHFATVYARVRTESHDYLIMEYVPEEEHNETRMWRVVEAAKHLGIDLSGDMWYRNMHGKRIIDYGYYKPV